MSKKARCSVDGCPNLAIFEAREKLGRERWRGFAELRCCRTHVDEVSAKLQWALQQDGNEEPVVQMIPIRSRR